MRAAIVVGIMAVAVMMVLISGGIDVGTAVAIFTMYSTTVFTLEWCRIYLGILFLPFPYYWHVSWGNQWVFGILSLANIDCYPWHVIHISWVFVDLYWLATHIGFTPESTNFPA